MNRIFFPSNVWNPIKLLLGSEFEVWLLGSRANGYAQRSSDWDFLVFGNEKLFIELSDSSPDPMVDLLIVKDGKNFESPWIRESYSQAQEGSLVDWKWERNSEFTASYVGVTKPDKWGVVRSRKLKAVRVISASVDV